MSKVGRSLTGSFPVQSRKEEVLIRALARLRQPRELVEGILGRGHHPLGVCLVHEFVHLLPWHHQSRLVHGIQCDIHVRQQVLNRLDQAQPNQCPKPVALRGGDAVADLDGHLVVPRAFANLIWRECPEGLEVVVNLVPKVLDHDSIAVLGVLVPRVETGRGMSAPALAVGGSSFIEGVRFVGKYVVESLVCGVDEVVNRVGAFRGGLLGLVGVVFPQVGVFA